MEHGQNGCTKCCGDDSRNLLLRKEWRKRAVCLLLLKGLRRSGCRGEDGTALQQLADDGVADEEAGGGNGQAVVAEDEGAGGKKAVDRGPQRTWKLRKKGMARVFCGSETTIGHGR